MNTYDSVFDQFALVRSREVGVSHVLEWARSLPPGAKILDLGCGHGVPLARALMKAGFEIFGVDVSPKMIAAFRANLPGVGAECASILRSDFFGRSFDGVLGWGVMHLLPAADQGEVVARVAGVLNAGGRFLFTAPQAPLEWDETFAGVSFPAVSLGADGYTRLLREHGLVLVDEYTDASDNHYYIAKRPTRR